MKINKAKLLVGTLAIASVAATVGSISGTVAWFQYSTRSTVEYSAATAHCTENLQIRLYDSALIATTGDSNRPYASAAKWDEAFPWSADLTSDMINNYIKVKRGAWNSTDSKWDEKNDTNLYPVTSGTLASGVAASFWTNPIYQYSGAYASPAWKAATVADYVELPIQLRVLDRNGADPDAFLAKKIYLSDLTIATKTVDDKEDITDALRVSFDSTEKVTFSKNGGSTTVSGSLDLNADGVYDQTVGYSWDTRTTFIYGGSAGLTAASTKIEKAAVLSEGEDDVKAAALARYIADDTDPYNIIGSSLGSTTTSAPLDVKVRIYLEGWQELAASTITAAPTAEGTAAAMKTLWDDDKFVGASFHIGMRFSAEAHTEH